MLNVEKEYAMIQSIASKVYWDSRFTKLRRRIDEEDLQQMVCLKLYHRDLYKVYSDQYSLKGFIFRVAIHCAINYSSLKSTQSEFTTLDDPLSDDTATTRSEMLTYEDTTGVPDLELLPTTYTVETNISYLERFFSDTDNERQTVILADGTEVFFSLRRFFRLFLETRASKSSMKLRVLNTITRQPIAQVTFDKAWKELVTTISEEIHNI